MKYRVRHSTTYEYAERFSSCHNQVHLIPRELPTQRCLVSELRVDPQPEWSERHTDWHGNVVESFALHTSHALLNITAMSDIEVIAPEAGLFQSSAGWEQVRGLLSDDVEPECFEALQHIFDSTYVRATPALAEYAAKSFTPGRPLLEATRDLTARIHADFKYDPKSTSLTTSVLEVLHRRRGVCQDFAHLQIGCLRSLGLAARYVSGYLRTDPPPGKPRLIGADASHAWCSVWCPKVGWTDFDPTNNVIPGDRHITLAWGADYGDVSPIKGVVLGGGEHQVRVSVDVMPL